MILLESVKINVASIMDFACKLVTAVDASTFDLCERLGGATESFGSGSSVFFTPWPVVTRGLKGPFYPFPLFGIEFGVNLVEPCPARDQPTVLASNDLELSACSPVFKFLICIYVRLLKRGGRLPSVMHCCVSFPTNKILHLAFTRSVGYESLRNV